MSEMTERRVGPLKPEIQYWVTVQAMADKKRMYLQELFDAFGFINKEFKPFW